MEKSSFTRSV